MDSFTDNINDDYRDLLVRGIAAAQAKEIEEARFYLNWVLRFENLPGDGQAEAWYWLSQICTDPAEKRQYLEAALANQPGNLRTRRAMAILDGKLNAADIVDPDHLPNIATGNPEKIKADRFVCPHCGGHMTYAPDGQSLICEYCENRQRIKIESEDRLVAKQDDFMIDMATVKGQLTPVAMHTVECKACGATYTLPPDQMTFNCAYCGSSYVLKQVETRNLVLPNGLIPFSVDENRAKLALHVWMQHLYKKTLPFDSPGHGFYLPAWVYEIGGVISWRCLIPKGNAWVPDSNSLPIHFNNITILASQRLPKALRTILDSYDMNQIVPYDPRYLVNWPAETYQISMAEAALDARKRALDEERKTVRQSYPHPVQDLILNTADMTVDYVKLILLPAWLTYYVIENQHYAVLINGQNSSILGEHRPTGVGLLISNILGGTKSIG